MCRKETLGDDEHGMDNGRRGAPLYDMNGWGGGEEVHETKPKSVLSVPSRVLSLKIRITAGWKSVLKLFFLGGGFRRIISYHCQRAVFKCRDF